MKATDLERMVAIVTTGRAQTDPQQRMTELRKLGFIPTGGRGPNAPDIGPEHCATYLIAVGGATHASRAGRAVLDFAPLVPHEKMWGDTLREILVCAFQDPKIGSRIKEIRFLHDETEVQMMWRDETDQIRYTMFHKDDLSEEMLGKRNLVSDETYISGWLISEINAALHHDDGQLLTQVKHEPEPLGVGAVLRAALVEEEEKSKAKPKRTRRRKK